jgi:hypothetical protein
MERGTSMDARHAAIGVLLTLMCGCTGMRDGSSGEPQWPRGRANAVEVLRARLPELRPDGQAITATRMI